MSPLKQRPLPTPRRFSVRLSSLIPSPGAQPRNFFEKPCLKTIFRSADHDQSSVLAGVWSRGWPVLALVGRRGAIHFSCLSVSLLVLSPSDTLQSATYVHLALSCLVSLCPNEPPVQLLSDGFWVHTIPGSTAARPTNIHERLSMSSADLLVLKLSKQQYF